MVSISNILDTTPDELLGIKVKESQDIQNLGDIAEFFFKLSRLITIKFETLTMDASPSDEGVYDNGIGYDSNFVKDYHAIYFENKHLDTFFKNWGKISSSIIDDECKQEVMDAWEASKIAQLKKIDSQYSFLTPLERGKQLCEIIDNTWVSFCAGDSDFMPIKESDLKLALKYIISPNARNDYNLTDLNSIYDHVHCYASHWHEVTDAVKRKKETIAPNIDAELPFTI